MTTQALLTVAKGAKPAAALLTTEEKNALLLAMADSLLAHADAILAANADDVEAARAHITPVMLDRLTLTQTRVEAMAAGMRSVAALPDPVGKVEREVRHQNGMLIQKRRVPMGVVASSTRAARTSLPTRRRCA